MSNKLYLSWVAVAHSDVLNVPMEVQALEPVFKAARETRKDGNWHPVYIPARTRFFCVAVAMGVYPAHFPIWDTLFGS